MAQPTHVYITTQSTAIKSLAIDGKDLVVQWKGAGKAKNKTYSYTGAGKLFGQIVSKHCTNKSLGAIINKLKKDYACVQYTGDLVNF